MKHGMTKVMTMVKAVGFPASYPIDSRFASETQASS